MNGIESLPVLYIRATNHYDAGCAIGSALKHWIEEYLNTSKDVKLFRKFYSTSSGQGIVTNYIATAKEFHPNIVSEIQGLAEGSEQDFVDIFMLQIASEILFCHASEISDTNNQTNDDAGKGCTDVLVNGEHCRVIGHNDDWSNEVASCTSLVHVTIEGGDVNEQFISYVYPGYLSGFCFGTNKDLVITLNTVRPKSANSNGVPLLILLRSLLSLSTIQECVEAMECKPVGCAYGMNINIADIGSTGMCSMEVYTEATVSSLHIQWVSHQTKSRDCWSFHHENVYNHTETLHESERDSEGSRHRADRVNQMAPPKSVDDVIAILGDTSDNKEPIYRIPNKTYLNPDVMTSATAIFDFKKKKLSVYRSNPKVSANPCLTMYFIKRTVNE